MYVSDAIVVAKSRSRQVVSFLFVRESEYQQLWHDIVNNHRRMLPHGKIPTRRPNVVAVDKHLKIHAAGTDDGDIVREANRQAQEDYEKKLFELRIGDISNPSEPKPYMTEKEIQEELTRLSPRNEGYFENGNG